MTHEIQHCHPSDEPLGSPKSLGTSARADNKGGMRGRRRVEPSSTQTGAWRKRTTKQVARTEESEAGGWWEGGGVTALCPCSRGAASQGNTDPSMWFERYCLPPRCHPGSRGGQKRLVRARILRWWEKRWAAGENTEAGRRPLTRTSYFSLPNPSKGKEKQVRGHSVIQLTVETGNSSWWRKIMDSC